VIYWKFEITEVIFISAMYILYSAECIMGMKGNLKSHFIHGERFSE
jgi:hypothetical protein